MIHKVDFVRVLFPQEYFKDVVFSTLVISCTLEPYAQSTVFKSYHDQCCTILTPATLSNIKGISQGSNVLLHVVNHDAEFIPVLRHLREMWISGTIRGKCFTLSRKLPQLDGSLLSATKVMQFASRTPVLLIPSGHTVRLRHPVRVYELFERKTLFLSGRGRSLTFHAQVQNCNAVVLLDTGASHSFVSLRFLNNHGINFQPGKDSAAIADGKLMPLHGKTKLQLTFEGFQSCANAYVAALNPSYDLILGMEWLEIHHAVLDCRNATCALKKGTKKFTLRPTPTVLLTVTKTNYITATQLLKVERRRGKILMVMLSQASDGIDIADEIDEEREWKVAGSLFENVPQPLRALVEEYKDVFPLDLPHHLPPERDVGHSIPLMEGSKPVFRPIYRLSPAERQEVEKQVADLLERGWINASKSPYGSPILFVQKKDGSLRMCVDYRALNKQTIKNRYALPRIDDLVDQLRGAKLFTSIDLAQGYHQIRISKSDTEKTAFRTPIGHYEYRVLPFGLTNAPATFQTLMNTIYQDFLGKFVLVYLDDILIFSKDVKEHVNHVSEVLQRLRNHKLFAKISKCEFMKESLTYLGLHISGDGVRPDPAKVKTIKAWNTPTNVHDVRSFLGFGNYFRKFIQGYSNLVAPLIALTKKDALFAWTKECEEAFQGVIWNLINAPTLVFPDPTRPYQVVTDASGSGLGAVLLQDDRPIAFESRKMTSAEKNYPVSEQELLAVVHALRTWRCYLEGCVGLTVITDHKPNTFLESQQVLSRRQARWSEFLSRFSFELVYRPGKTNMADPLSRKAPCANVSTVLLAQVRQNSKQSVRSALLTDTMLSSHLDYAGECMALETNSHTGRLHCQPSSILEWIKSQYSYDPLFRGDPLGQSEQPHRAISVDLRDGIYYHGDQIYVPQHNPLRQFLLAQYHESLWSGHWGVAKTYASIRRDFYWPNLLSEVKAYVSTCDTCQRGKTLNLPPPGKLVPLQIPARKWSSISMDFIMELPLTSNGHNAILVFVDRLTKVLC